ncbi:hypothetical protein DSO57_1036635 [Entomophthora muscae]|uniref:Uncharacterized protein n=1 Tax=Entomophthora muscae TaxID=34485 RepID=A0ACC2RDV9_9FUNG|nr:hypothetical protein DSO57_1036635 [Entomophthora muscae]
MMEDAKTSRHGGRLLAKQEKQPPPSPRRDGYPPLGDDSHYKRREELASPPLSRPSLACPRLPSLASRPPSGGGRGWGRVPGPSSFLTVGSRPTQWFLSNRVPLLQRNN